MTEMAAGGAVRALVLAGYGLNCDWETAHSFELAGGEARRVHVNDLIAREEKLSDYRILAFGGGFSWGDDHGAGVLLATRLRYNLGDEIQRFVADGGLVIGICNGFQALVNLGLLPALDGDYGARTVALTTNDCGNFRDDWVTLRTEPDSSCVFTRGIEKLDLPIRHGEGKLFAAKDVIGRLEAEGQVALRYALPDGSPAGGVFPWNPNGSLADIAGITDPTGRVFGLMPHPEAHNDATNHPDWTRLKEMAKRRGAAWTGGEGEGIRIFRNAVEHARQSS